MSEQTAPQPGDLKVWYIPQVPMPAFEQRVETVQEGLKVLDILSRFSLYEYENRVKPDYSDAGGVSRYEQDGPGSYDWYDVDPTDEEWQ